MISTLMEWLKFATWSKFFIGLVTVVSGIVLFTVWENRQATYDNIIAPASVGDWKLTPPSPAAVKLFEDFAKTHPNIAIITVVDADPIANRRTPIYRYFNNVAVQRFIEDRQNAGNSGGGQLYGMDPDANRQTLAIFSAQVICEPADKGFFAKSFPGIEKLVTFSCRVPLPPIYGLTTGWLALHFTGPQTQTPALVQDLMILATSYYKVDILPHQRKL